MTQDLPPADHVDDSTPNVARMYDYFLGGFHNFAADRDLADRTIAAWPQVPAIARANRAFLGRAVGHLAGSGVRQFLDLGSGVPTVGNVHEIAQRHDPGSRVVYVDVEPVAVAHSREILQDNPNADVVQADLRHPEDILGDPAVTRLLDPSRPTALLMVAVLHFVPDSDAVAKAIRTYREALGPGSWIVVSHGTDEIAADAGRDVRDLYRRTSSPAVSRTRAELTALLEGYELVEPGLVPADRWQPGTAAATGDAGGCPVWAGIGRAR